MKLIKYTTFTLPFIIFALIVILLWRGLSLHPSEVPSPLINKPAPQFQLPDLLMKGKFVKSSDFKGHITLLNVWATWCYACAMEHDFLLKLAQKGAIIIYGLNYKDNLSDAKKWLKIHGNPYKHIAVDQNGQTAIDWGVYGTPETFVIDKKGIIRYKQVGPVTPENWENTLKPIIDRLNKTPENLIKP